jgi:hypothetical protein
LAFKIVDIEKETLMEEGFLGAVIGASLGSLIIGLINLWQQRRDHAHAAKMQQAQWNKESEWRRQGERNALGLQIHAHDAARADQRNEWDRQREDQRLQFEHASLVAVQDVITRFSDASRWIHLEKRSRHNFASRTNRDEGEEYESSYPGIAEHQVTFNSLRFNILPIISRVRNERVREAALDLCWLDLDMVLLHPTTWQGRIYGGDDPVEIQERRLPQFIRMAGKLLRDESIENEDFPAITRTRGDGYLVRDAMEEER